MTDESRLSRMEDKLDQLRTGVLSNVVKLEEMLIALTKRTDRLEYRLDLQEGGLDSVKEKIGSTREAMSAASSNLRSMERMGWIVLGIGASVITWALTQ